MEGEVLSGERESVSWRDLASQDFTFAANRINLLQPDINHVFDLSCFK
jgi:hypothetical protein